MDRSGGANTFRIVNIGAGEGYYAVGFARRAKRGQEIIAFERDENGRQLMRDLSKRNHIVNLTIHGQCGIDELNSVLSSCGQTLVICDVEGFEMELLDPVRVEGLAKAWILVELHDFLCAGTSEVICRRVAPTHNIQKTASAPRRWSDFPAQRSFAALLPRRVALRAMDEGRGSEMSWLSMQPLEFC